MDGGAEERAISDTAPNSDQEDAPEPEAFLEARHQPDGASSSHSDLEPMDDFQSERADSVSDMLCCASAQVIPPKSPITSSYRVLDHLHSSQLPRPSPQTTTARLNSLLSIDTTVSSASTAQNPPLLSAPCRSTAASTSRHISCSLRDRHLERERTPVKDNSATYSSGSSVIQSADDLVSDSLLAHKRKSEAERELISPGKRVKAMSEVTTSSIILNAHAYTANHQSYGHIHVSPGTPTRRRPSCKTRPPPNLDTWLETFQKWDSAEKTHALNELIETCDVAHVRHVMAVIEPQFQRDFISLLPKELALYVLSFLSSRDLLRAAQTCQYWRTLTEDTLLWRAKCLESGADLGLAFNDPDSPAYQGNDHELDWKAVFLRAYLIKLHWKKGEVRPPKLLRGHEDHVITCLEFSGNRIVSGSDDNTLKVWSVDTGECLRTLVGHTGGVWSSQMKDNIVISGSTDRTLRVWDTESGECLHTLLGHTSTVRCMHLHDTVVVSGSRDATLRMWDVMTGECLHVLMGHVAAVRCVQYDGSKVVSGAYDYTVRVWDPQTEACIHVLNGHTNRVYSLQFDGKHIVSGSLDTSIRVWDVVSGNCLHTLVGHQSLTSGMELQDGTLVSGNADSTVKVWDIVTGSCLQTLSGPNKHQSAVTCLQFNRRFVITSSDDGTVKLWSLKTGAFIRNLVTLESGGSGGVVWRVKADNSRLVCAAGSRNGTEDTKLIVLDFGLEEKNEKFLSS